MADTIRVLVTLAEHANPQLVVGGEAQEVRDVAVGSARVLHAGVAVDGPHGPSERVVERVVVGRGGAVCEGVAP